MSEENVKREESEFHSSVSYLNRINQWFYYSGKARMSLDAFNWMQSVILIYAELSTEMKKDEQEEVDKIIEELFPDVMKNENVNITTRMKCIPRNLWFRLHRLELKLRNVMRESGLQQKLRNSFEDVML